MPAVRLSRRRRSSLAISFNPAKAGIYGIHSPSPRPVTFAPNVTPGTYVEPESSSSSTTPEPGSPTSTLFPPSQTPAPAPSRRRVPPGKRRSLGYIPRPPNAFMLFRADFVRQKHVPGSIETNHGSLSKIIGNCWRALPLDEKRVWEVKAKHAKAEHKARYPEYRFRPVHNKNKEKKKDKPTATFEDERRCEEVAQLLLEGKKGDELAAAVRNLDRMHEDTPPPVYHHRRSSSVPLPNDYYPHHNIALPSVSFLSHSRPASPVGSISRSTRLMLGQRRASSARPATHFRSWTMPTPSSLHRDDSPLPEVDTSLFEPSFLDASANFSFPVHDGSQHNQHPFNVNDLISSLPSQHGLGPLEGIAPDSQPHPCYTSSNPELDPLTWLPLDPSQYSISTSQPHSHPSSTYSGSPAPSDHPLPAPVPLHAPQPQNPHATAPVFNDMWKEFSGSYTDHTYDPSLTVNMDFNQHAHVHGQVQDQSCAAALQDYATGLESLFQPTPFNTGYGYEYNDMLHE